MEKIFEFNSQEIESLFWLRSKTLDLITLLSAFFEKQFSNTKYQKISYEHYAKPLITRFCFVHQCYLQNTMPPLWSPDVVCLPLVTMWFLASATSLRGYFLPSGVFFTLPSLLLSSRLPWGCNIQPQSH